MLWIRPSIAHRLKDHAMSLRCRMRPEKST
jgi:hypothetical protein